MFGLACCALEMIGTAASRFDIARFGMDIFRWSPRQADLMIVAGTLTWKMAPAVKLVYEQMAEPKVVIALGSCTMTGGMYWDSYNTIKRLEDYLPVTMYIPGCPPRPEAIFEACEKIFKHVKELK